jgi:hypothetical protein
MKGIATIRLPNGALRVVGLHWYEAHGIGKRDLKNELVRIVDESGEDYLYHRDHFVFVDFPAAVKRKILALTRAA